MKARIDTSQRKKQKQTMNKNKKEKTLCKEDPWLQNDNAP
jgi:hypothetical protein